MKAHQAQWCPPSLSDMILQAEFWDRSAERAQTMKVGEYYFIKNARMRISNGGYLEAKVADATITQLHEKDAESEPNLKALLQ